MERNIDLYVREDGKLIYLEHSIYNYHSIEVWEVIGVNSFTMKWVIRKINVF